MSFVSSIPPKFTREYISSQQAITLGAILTLAHGLGVAPKIVQVVLHCVTADRNYAVGDEILLSHGENFLNTSIVGKSIQLDSSNIYIITDSVAGFEYIVDRATFGGATLTIASWKLIVKAWA